MKVRSVVTLALLAGLLVAPVLPATVPAARADGCPTTPYPGDAAPKASIAAWMARGASARGIPGELPVMAALVESNLVNLTSQVSDSQGYFQMRKSIWGGSYPGFPDDPDLQLDWFLDQATVARTPPYPPDTAWGEWVADVQRPAAQYRGRYQLRLEDARTLIGPPCTAPDTVAPRSDVRAPARQKALKGKGVRVAVRCPDEPCTAAVRARVLLGKRPQLAAPLATVAAGQRVSVKVRLRPAVRRMVARAVARHQRVPVRVTVTTADAAGNTGGVILRVQITG